MRLDERINRPLCIPRAAFALPALIAARALALVTTIYTFLAFKARLPGGPIGFDEGFFVWSGWSILKGLVPYRDFVEIKPPVLFLAHAAALRLFGFEGCRFRIFFEIFACTAILAFQVALMSRRVGTLMSLALALAVCSLFVGPWHDTSLADAESVGFSFYLLGLAALLARTKYRRVADSIAAALMTCAVLSKEPFAASVIPTWVACMWLDYPVVTARQRAPQYIKSTMIGIAAVVLPLCIWLLLNGGLKCYFDTLVLEHTLFGDPQHSYATSLGIFQPKGPLADALFSWQKVRTIFFNVKVLGHLSLFGVAWLIFTPLQSWPLFLMSVATLAGGLYSTTIGHCFWGHYFILAQCGVAFAAAVGTISLSTRLNQIGPPIRVFLGVAALVAVLIPVWPIIAGYQITNGWDAAPMRGEPFRKVRAFIAQNTLPTDKIFTTGAPSLYVETDRIDAARIVRSDELLDVLPGNSDREKARDLFDELVAGRPKVVFLDPSAAARNRRYVESAILPFLQENHYQRAGTDLYIRPD